MAATPKAPKMQATLGLTGVTVNAMALIAPGAFVDHIRHELAKLYPGAGSSYLFAEKAFLNTTKTYRFNGRST